MSVETITTISPNTGEAILTRNGLSPADLDLLPDIATKAFQSFRKTTLEERQAIVKKFLKGLTDAQAELAEELTVQMGRPIAYTGKEIATAVKRAEYLLKISSDVLKDSEGEAEKGFKRFIRRVPVGPVLIVFAWNVSLCFPRRILPAPFSRHTHTSCLIVPLSDPRQLSHSRPSRG
jgi:acyl-CoA reductase-like NAD-dependent aldehyde dehydrogenase